jgi:CHAD domain-containing protein
MAFRFRRKESAAEGVRRVVREQTALAVSLLADRAGDIAENIHEARRCIKRLRATLRLVRKWMHEDTNDTGNIALRDISRKLSGTRDADVALETFEQLAPELNGPEVQRIRTLLKEATRRMRRRALTANVLASIATGLRDTGHALVQADFAENGWPLISSGIQESYTRARNTARRLTDDTEATVVHEWRKVTKALFFQLELTRRALAKPQRRLLRQLEKLGLLLGEHHDLETLRITLAEYPGSTKFAALNDLIASELARRLKQARRIAKDIFGGRPRSFVSAIRVGWNEWRG